MSATAKSVALFDRLPSVRGVYRADYPLSRITWFKVGGPADVLFRPADTEDLAAFLSACPRDIQVTVLGVGSNVLVRDGGIRGVVIRLGRGFTDVAVRDTRIEAGGGALDINIARVAAQHGLAGLEFLSGIPGTIGGAVRMNAGAYNGDLGGVLDSVTMLDRTGQSTTIASEDLTFSYRQSRLPAQAIVVACRLVGVLGEVAPIHRRMAEIKQAREATQPVRSRTGGSTFRNPGGPGSDAPRAWQLIDAAGCRGLRRGGAMISPVHCNFLENVGEASAADLEALGNEVRQRVADHSGILLQWEIERIGEPSGGAP
ncbi:MAG: UDP-N-acetylmuramate dehydrogenase [Alphaproteobacteria bacterium]